jgi:hypothetical protein
MLRLLKAQRERQHIAAPQKTWQPHPQVRAHPAIQRAVGESIERNPAGEVAAMLCCNNIVLRRKEHCRRFILQSQSQSLRMSMQNATVLITTKQHNTNKRHKGCTAALITHACCHAGWTTYHCKPPSSFMTSLKLTTSDATAAADNPSPNVHSEAMHHTSPGCTKKAVSSRTRHH